MKKYNITVTEGANQRIKFLLDMESNKNSYFRVSVDGGGCSGFQYKFSFDDIKNDDDLVISCNDSVVLVDEISADLIKDSEIHYLDELGASHFVVQNPHATATCGCGNSFAV